VNLGLTAQAINFAQSAFMGHRVSLTMPVDFMNEYFTWERDSGEARPRGRFTNEPTPVGITAMPSFKLLLERALGSAYTDLDGVAGGLNYSSPALDATADMKRDTSITNNTWVYTGTNTTSVTVGANTVIVPGAVETPAPTTHYSANDLVMAYVLNKCFGSSAYDAYGVVYNLSDAFGMLKDEDLAAAIEASLSEEDGKASSAPTTAGQDMGRVDEMFRALLSIDPQRFYKNGSQIDGLFESNPDTPTPPATNWNGNWCLGVGDKIEIPVRLYFRAPVTVLSVVDNAKNPSSATPDEVETVFIKGANTALFEPLTGAPLVGTTAAELAAEAKNGNMMSLRLQITCSSPVLPAGETRATSEVSGATPTPGVAVAVNPIFYDGANYGTQKAIAIVYANLGSGTWVPDYGVSGLPTGVSGELNGSVLTLTYDPLVGSANTPGLGAVSVSVTISGGTGAAPPAQTIKITISAPPA
jgi:hypothetical protein